MHTRACQIKMRKIERQTAMQIAVSLCLLGATLFVILTDRYDPNTKHWAFATAGTILGFWLR
jgi:hypothetical protein